MTDELIAFLRARLDEDERDARAACHDGRGEWHREPGQGVLEPAGNICCEKGWTVVYDEGAPTAQQAEHVARWDPARVLADVAAKRATLDEIAGWRHLDSCPQATAQPYPFDDPCDCGLDARRDRLVRLLVAPYGDHPEYRAEWGPQ